ncbi:hypothetical protein ACQEU8_04390 [Streptomyces sp. CA-250714]|uniref:hypothetical protein n=1 Tax=Streptomyces sp. CA-250714 TaxID=3240060 RepID=UPI003D8B3F8C
MKRIQKVRTMVGLGAFLWVSLSYRLAENLGDVAKARFDQSWITVLALSVTFPVLVGVLVALARPAQRRELLRRAARPFGAIVAIFAGMFLFPLQVLTGFGSGLFAGNLPMTILEHTATVITIVWVLPFVIYGVAMSLVHVFRTADIHETVPPLIAMTVVWEMLIVDLFTGAYAGVPGPLRMIMLVGAPVSVTAVGLWELHRLRAYYGLRLRGALLR